MTEFRFCQIALIPALLVGLFALVGCSIESDADPGLEATETDEALATTVENELPPVEVTELNLGPIEAVLRFSTNLEAESEVQVFSQASRRVVELRVEEGARVQKGDLLLRLEDDEQRSSLARTESQLKKAQREFERQKSLFEKELISEQAWNEATYEVEQIELQMEDSRRNLTYTEVRAPISGTITARMVNLGDTITVNQDLFDFVDFNTIVARIYVPEKELASLEPGQQARIFSDSLATARSGQIVRIAPIVDPRSGTVKVTVGIPSNQALLPGMYVEVDLVTDALEAALLIPKKAIVYADTQAYLFRIKESKVERLALHVTLEDQENVVAEGADFSVGDLVVVAGQAGLKNGAKVRQVQSVPSRAERAGEAP
jgi:membrane fusion protein (multidrug efflux system)